MELGIVDKNRTITINRGLDGVTGEGLAGQTSPEMDTIDETIMIIAL